MHKTRIRSDGAVPDTVLFTSYKEDAFAYHSMNRFCVDARIANLFTMCNRMDKSACEVSSPYKMHLHSFALIV